MLHEFLIANRTSLIRRCRISVEQRSALGASCADQEFGIPVFLDQVIKTLQAEGASELAMSYKISGAADGAVQDRSEIGVMAKLHAQELYRQGFTFDEVVRGYGDICQAITSLAIEDGVSIAVSEFHIVNRCLDNATANAVTEFSNHQHIQTASNGKVVESPDHVFALQVRNRIQSAQLALNALKAGTIGYNGLTGAKLDELLESLRVLADRNLTSLSIRGDRRHWGSIETLTPPGGELRSAYRS
jgi:hypothetical protein